MHMRCWLFNPSPSGDVATLAKDAGVPAKGPETREAIHEINSRVHVYKADWQARLDQIVSTFSQEANTNLK